MARRKTQKHTTANLGYEDQLWTAADALRNLAVELLEMAVKKYQNRTFETSQIIEELIQLVCTMCEAGARGEQLGLSDDEVAFYDALETNDSVVKALCKPTLQKITRELVENVHSNVAIDWTICENVCAKLCILVKRIFRKYGYPSDKQKKASQTVLEQAGVLSEIWVVG